MGRHVIGAIPTDWHSAICATCDRSLGACECEPHATLFAPAVILLPQHVVVHPTARVDAFVKVEGGRGVYIGAYTHVASFVHLNIGGERLTLGDGVGIASGARIITASAGPSAANVSPLLPDAIAERSAVIVGDGALVGANAVVLPGCHLGVRAILGAGSVLTRPIPCDEIWAGVPARRLGNRR